MRQAREKGERAVDMTQGSIHRQMLRFALPLMAGYLFQQMYNIVDTWVVGNFIGNEAYAAVGASSLVTTMLVGLFFGLSAGAGTVIAQHYGARQYDKVKDLVHTAILGTFILGVFLSVLGIVITPAMLRLMDIPKELERDATVYLAIYFAGLLGLVVYNMGSGVLRAIGDSRRPFYFLAVCALLNTGLDLLFVIQFDMGVAGVALATILSQFASAALVAMVLLRTSACVKLQLRALAIHGQPLKKMLSVGLPSAVSQALPGLANIYGRSYINFFGADVMSGWTSYAKIDHLILLPMQALLLATTTFVAQNLGANQIDRAREGVKRAQFMTLACTAALVIPVMALAPFLVAFFNDKPEVVEYGTVILRWISPAYILVGINYIHTGALRGAGITRGPMLISLASYVFFRQLYLFVMANFICNELLPIIMGFPAAWLLCCILIMICYKRADFYNRCLVEVPEGETG